MSDEQKELWEKINNDIEYLYMEARALDYQSMLVLDRLMINRNTFNGIVESEKHDIYLPNELEQFAESEYRLLKFFVLEKKLRICKKCGLDIDKAEPICHPNDDTLFSNILIKTQNIDEINNIK